MCAARSGRPAPGGRLRVTVCPSVVGFPLTRLRMRRIVALVLAALCCPTLLLAQFGDLAAGPYKRLVIRGAHVIPGHGGPPAGPYDIVIEGNVITEMLPFDPVAAERRGRTERPTGDRVIDATGMFVMPGMFDLHTHIRTQPLPLEYVYLLKLAMGVTTMVPAADRGLDSALAQAELSKANRVLAPRMFPLASWGAGTRFTRRRTARSPRSTSRRAPTPS
jgi:hypothetical protein